MPTSFYYNQFFNDKELKAIRNLRRLDAKRLPLSCVAGFLFSILIPFFLITLPGASDKEMYFIIGYISSAAGILVACSLNSWINMHIERQFSSKWDALFYERSGQTKESLKHMIDELEATDKLV